MNQTQYRTAPIQSRTDVQMNKVLRSTYALLSMTLLFSALMAGLSMALNWPQVGFIGLIAGYFGLMFLTTKLRNSAWGLVSLFAMTGFMGATLGPMINLYLVSFSNGGDIVMLALGGTGVIFLSMSGLALTSKRDYSFMGKFLFIGLAVAILAMFANFFFQIPALALAISAMVVMLMAGLILYQTQQIIRGGETNYIMATMSLFISIFNLFTSLLHLLGMGFGED